MTRFPKVRRRCVPQPARGVIVTGGAAIGADIVRAFAEQGCRVGFVDRDAGRRRRAGGRPGGRSLRALRRDRRYRRCRRRSRGRGRGRRRRCWSTMSPTTSATASRTVTPAYFDERIAVNLRPALLRRRPVLARCARAAASSTSARAAGRTRRAASPSTPPPSRPCRLHALPSAQAEARPSRCRHR